MAVTNTAQPTIEQLIVSELLMDEKLYPRHHVDMMHVRTLQEALRAGIVLPPIVVDSGSKRVTDGWHRLRATEAEYGAEAQIMCELVDYASEAEMVRDAVARNANHGRMLSMYDKARCVLMMKKYGFDGVARRGKARRGVWKV